MSEDPTNVIEDDALRASESPALEDVRELLHTTTHEHNGLLSEPPTVREDEADSAGCSPSLESEDDGPHESNPAYAERPVPIRTEVTALSLMGHGKTDTEATNERLIELDCPLPQSISKETSDAPDATSCVEKGLDHASTSEFNNEESADAENLSSQANDNEVLDAADVISGTITEDYHTSSSVAGTAPSASKNVMCENKGAAGMSHEDVLESQDSDMVVCSPKASAKTPRKEEVDTQSLLSENIPNSSPRKAMTPASTKTPKQTYGIVHVRADTPGGSPQIGTSLLRRESLRRRQSPRKRADMRKSRSPKKRDTLQRRDTLQEREILQRVIAEAAPDQDLEDLDHGRSAQKIQAFDGNTQDSPDAAPNNEPTSGLAIDSAEAALPPLQDDENKDLHRALEAIEAYESPEKSDEGDAPLLASTNNPDVREAIDQANETIAKMEIDQATQTMDVTVEKTESPKRKTRSETRFSDDTSMLKEFLNRAQAKKAAKTPVFSAPDLHKPQVSPRRSPRKALGSHDDNALSPQKSREIANRPGTPPGKPKPESPDPDDADDIGAEPTSCRRSTRTRLPAPSKTPPGAPSFIPVRRADGTDPVVLQKSQAQELAMVTRANTRRNKGQSKPPLLALHDLPAEIAEIAVITKARGKQSKTVDWAERLASYQDAKETGEAEEARPKVRRMKGLGSANGTPAPKRATSIVGSSNGTPAPKRLRGKGL